MPTTKEVIKTGLTANYVGYWTLAQAIKEATQNIVYGSLKAEVKPKIEYNNGIGIMEDSYVGFEKRHLYLGESEQRGDDDGLGNFGEGWKMFLLICARNNIVHRVDTVGFSFYGVMEDTPHGVKSLEIVVEENDRQVGTRVVVECSEEEFEKGTMGFAVTQGIEKEYCGDLSLIPNRYCELYINGVRIENADTSNPLGIHYAYHIKDRSLVNRDRSQVDTEKVYDLISKIWSAQDDRDTIKEYVQRAYNGEVAEDIQRGPNGFSIKYGNRSMWREIIAEIMGCKPEQLVIPSRIAELDKEAEYRSYVLVKVPDKWNYMLSWIDIKSVRDVITAKFSEMKEIEVEDLTDYEYQVFKRAKIDTKKALDLSAIKDLPPIKIVDEIKDANGVTDADGMYDPESKTVYVKRDQLLRQDKATRVLIHECIHWKTGAGDNSEWFTRGFESAILNLLGYK